MLVVSAEALGRRRAQLTELYDVPCLIETYNVSEVSNVARECRAEDGLHLLTDDLFFELITEAELSREAAEESYIPQARTVDELEEGMRGELVITTLRRHALPMVRFRTGDLVQMRSAQPRSEGHSAPRISLRGRVSDQFIEVAGGKLPVTLMDALVPYDSPMGLVQDWEARILTDRGSSVLQLRFFVQAVVDEESLRRELRERFLRLFGDDQFYLRSLVDTGTARLTIECAEAGTETLGLSGKRRR